MGDSALLYEGQETSVLPRTVCDLPTKGVLYQPRMTTGSQVRYAWRTIA
jgi:hypothetical protein